jgi:hypothetical protein
LNSLCLQTGGQQQQQQQTLEQEHEDLQTSAAAAAAAAAAPSSSSSEEVALLLTGVTAGLQRDFEWMVSCYPDSACALCIVMTHKYAFQIRLQMKCHFVVNMQRSLYLANRTHERCIYKRSMSHADCLQQ